MRKTHKTTMANKQHLIEDLQDIIEERDRMIRQLQGDDRDTESTARDNDKVSESDIPFCSACIFLSSCNDKVKSHRVSPSCTNVFSLCSHCCLYSHDGG